MGEIIYNKLVRDGIPRVIEGEGKIAVTRIVSESEKPEVVSSKVVEEAIELHAAKTREERVDERADLEEILEAHDALHGITREEIDEARRKKSLAKGAFNDLIFLERVVDND